MKEYEKVIRKADPRDRDNIENTIGNLVDGSVSGVKLKGSNFYKYRVGDFRIIYHLNEKDAVVIDDVRRRNEKTYRDF